MKENFWHSKIFIFGLLIILILLVIASGREAYRNYKINQEIRGLQKKIDELKESNKELTELEKYLQSPEFLEKEARLKLNLIKDGEKLVIIKRSEEESNLKESKPEENKNIPNILKWWEYFFGRR
ncbi:MAG: FtsB family cell division protein [Patescibacteria group bacterium]